MPDITTTSPWFPGPANPLKLPADLPVKGTAIKFVMVKPDDIDQEEWEDSLPDPSLYPILSGCFYVKKKRPAVECDQTDPDEVCWSFVAWWSPIVTEHDALCAAVAALAKESKKDDD